MAEPRRPLHTWIGSATPDSITVAGRDLPSEVMGRLSLTDLTYLLLTRRDPTPSERRVLDAVLVSLADHGLTPSALAARLTYTGAPEAIQGAVAAGLLGAGSVFLGPAGDTAIFLAAALEGRAEDEPALPDLARTLVEEQLHQGRRIPGLGHPIHKQADPRTARLYDLAREEGVLGPHAHLLAELARAQQHLTGRHLPINGAGAAGAVLVDIGIPAASVRGVVLIARTAGLVAHLAEEAQSPLGMRLWQEAERAAGEPGPGPRF